MGALAVAATLLALIPFGTASDAAPNLPARRGAAWIVKGQQANGAFFTESQDVDMTAATLAAAVAGGTGGASVDRALEYIETNGQARATRGAFTGRIIAGIVAGGANPRDFGGVNYVEILFTQYDSVTGAFDSTDLVSNLIAANGALAAGEALPQSGVDYIRSNSCPSGGFGSRNHCDSGPDVNATAWAINVLVAAGRASDPAVAAAAEYMRSVQNDDGGFGRSANTPTNSDSTGLALSAVQALGENPQKAPWRRSDQANPVYALRALQHRSGGFRTFASDSEPNGISTVNAVPGMAGASYPIPPIPPNDPDAPGTRSKPRSNGELDTEDEPESEGEDMPPSAARVIAAEPQQNGIDPARSAPDGRGSVKPGHPDQSFSKPQPYKDPTSRRRLIAWAGLVVSIGMVGSGVQVLRYTRLR